MCIDVICGQDTLDAVETLLKKHEAFERAATTQEERFLALERVTTVGYEVLTVLSPCRLALCWLAVQLWHDPSLSQTLLSK